MRLPSKDSAVFRAIVTGGQVLATCVVLWVINPEFKQVIERCYKDIVPMIAGGAGIASFVTNFFRGDVRNY